MKVKACSCSINCSTFLYVFPSCIFPLPQYLFLQVSYKKELVSRLRSSNLRLFLFSQAPRKRGPCPGRSRENRSFCSFRRLSAISALLPEGRSVLPKPPAKSVSPLNSSSCFSSRKHTLPAVCPGVATTRKRMPPKSTNWLCEMVFVILGNRSPGKNCEQVAAASTAFTAFASFSCIATFALGKRQSHPKWSAWQWVWIMSEMSFGVSSSAESPEIIPALLSSVLESTSTFSSPPSRRKQLLPSL